MGLEKKACVVFAVAAAICTASASSCTSPEPEGILLSNETGIDLAYVYLVPNPRDDPNDPTVPQEYQVADLAPGLSTTYRAIPAEDGCLIAPIVARRTDGTEVARLPAGTCWDPVRTWTLDEGDL